MIDLSKTLFGNQNPMEVVSQNPTEDLNRLMVRSTLHNLATALVKPESVDIVLRHGDLIKAIQSGEIQTLGETGLWFPVEAYLQEKQMETPSFAGKYMSDQHTWIASDFEGLIRISALRTEDLMVRLVFKMGLVEGARDSSDLLPKDFEGSKNKFVKWVRLNRPQDYVGVKEHFDLLHLFRNAFSHGLSRAEMPGLQWRPNSWGLDVLKKHGWIPQNYTRTIGYALTLSFQPDSQYFGLFRIIAWCHDYLQGINESEPRSSLIEVIDAVEQIVNARKRMESESPDAAQD